jgi:hypothetical protein
MPSQKQAAAARRNVRKASTAEGGVGARQCAATIARSLHADPHVRLRIVGAPKKSIVRVGDASPSRNGRSPYRNLLEIREGLRLFPLRVSPPQSIEALNG